MALNQDGRLIEEKTAGGNTYVFGEKQINAQRSVQVDGEGKIVESMELYGLSTDIKPTIDLKVGTSFFEIDTTDAYMWDGSQWRPI